MKVILRNARNQDFFASRKNIFKLNSYMPFFGTVVFSKLFFEDVKKARFWDFYKCNFVPRASERLGGGRGMLVNTFTTQGTNLKLTRSLIDHLDIISLLHSRKWGDTQMTL